MIDDQELQQIRQEAYEAITNIAGELVLGYDVEIEEMEEKMFPWFNQVIVQKMDDYAMEEGYILEDTRHEDHSVEVNKLFPDIHAKPEGESFRATYTQLLHELDLEYEEGMFVAEVASNYIEERTEQIYNVITERVGNEQH